MSLSRCCRLVPPAIDPDTYAAVTLGGMLLILSFLLNPRLGGLVLAAFEIAMARLIRVTRMAIHGGQSMPCAPVTLMRPRPQWRC